MSSWLLLHLNTTSLIYPINLNMRVNAVAAVPSNDEATRWSGSPELLGHNPATQKPSVELWAHTDLSETCRFRPKQFKAFKPCGAHL